MPDRFQSFLDHDIRLFINKNLISLIIITLNYNKKHTKMNTKFVSNNLDATMAVIYKPRNNHPDNTIVRMERE